MPYESEYVSKLTTLAFADDDAIYTAEEMDEINNNLDYRISTLDNEHSRLETDIATLKDLVAAMETRIEDVEGRTSLGRRVLGPMCDTENRFVFLGIFSIRNSIPINWVLHQNEKMVKEYGYSVLSDAYVERICKYFHKNPSEGEEIRAVLQYDGVKPFRKRGGVE